MSKSTSKKKRLQQYMPYFGFHSVELWLKILILVTQKLSYSLGSDSNKKIKTNVLQLVLNFQMYSINYIGYMRFAHEK